MLDKTLLRKSWNEYDDPLFREIFIRHIGFPNSQVAAGILAKEFGISVSKVNTLYRQFAKAVAKDHMIDTDKLPLRSQGTKMWWTIIATEGEGGKKNELRIKHELVEVVKESEL